jgi:S-adenosylmethionine hydrolase
MPLAAFLTDYGPASEHVGALHAVLARKAPGVDRIDLAHDLPAGDVRFGALVLERTARLAPGAVVVAVVDPGVGTPRRGVAIGTTEGGALIGPDNGLLALAADSLEADRAVALAGPGDGPATFHGRDVFAPIAARLLMGEELAQVGEPIELASLVRPDLPRPLVADGSVMTRVAGVDRFGNIALHASGADLSAADLAPGDELRIVLPEGEVTATLARVFGDVPEGSLLIHIDSHGMAAIAANGASAAESLEVVPDMPVRILRGAVD